MKNQEKIGLSIGSATGENVRNIGSFGINSCHAALWLREDCPATSGGCGKSSACAMCAVTESSMTSSKRWRRTALSTSKSP
ncbi:MAG: hypothetical protein V8T86_18790 [Victivallis sp.]